MPTRHHSTAAPRLELIAIAAALAAIAAVAFLLLRLGAGEAAQTRGNLSREGRSQRPSHP